MVCHVHVVIASNGLIQTRRSLFGARKSRICWRKRGFPHLGKLFQEVRYLSLICLVVKHSDDPLPREDHGRERRPVRQLHGNVRRGVDVVDEARFCDGDGVISGFDEVGIDHQNGENFIRMGMQPLRDSRQVGLESAHVELCARGMAEANGGIDIV